MWSSNSTPGYMSKKYKNTTQKDAVTPMFRAVLFVTAKVVKVCNQSKCPSTDEWIKKMWYISTMEYYWAIKKHEILPFAATWTDSEGIMLNEVSQKKKYTSQYHFYVESKKHNKLVNKTKKQQIHRHTKQTSGHQWGKGSCADRGVGERVTAG